MSTMKWNVCGRRSGVGAGGVRPAQSGQHVLHERRPAVSDGHAAAARLLPRRAGQAPAALGRPPDVAVRPGPRQNVERRLRHPQAGRLQADALALPFPVQGLPPGTTATCFHLVLHTILSFTEFYRVLPSFI